MIFSNKGDAIPKFGDGYYTDEGRAYRSGATLFFPDGSTAIESEQALFSGKGAITVSGNMLYTPHGVYTLSGTILYGPNGKTWTGVGSMEDAKVIAAMEF